jgi:hypothetical protein
MSRMRLGFRETEEYLYIIRDLENELTYLCEHKHPRSLEAMILEEAVIISEEEFRMGIKYGNESKPKKEV